MPKLVSELQTSLEAYVHPDLAFLDVLNEVLNQLASRGIWKDLTFEESIQLAQSDRFFTLPDNADAVLHAIVNNEPAPVKPLWNAFVNEGASSGRMGAWYGVEDAGYVPTKELLSEEHYYTLFLMPDHRWGDDKIDPTVGVRTDADFAGTETVTVVYENWEGVVKSVTDTVVAQDTPQMLSARSVRNIRSVVYNGFDTVPGLLVAVPTAYFGDMTSTDGASGTIYQTVNMGSTFEVAEDLSVWDLPANFYVASAGSTDDFDSGVAVVADASDTGDDFRLNISTLTNWTTPILTLPIVLFESDIYDDVLYKEGAAEEAKAVAVCDGTGIARHRLFRQQDPGNSVHLLLRKKIPKYTAVTEIVELDNLSALKYAILANTAEFNNDPKQADIWWDAAERELNNELSKTLGAAQPQVIFDPSGGQGGIESLQ